MSALNVLNEKKNFTMRFHILVISSVLAVSLVPQAESVADGDCSTTSSACPSGGECVDFSCSDCDVEPRKCMRSVERCAKLNCAEGEGCYLKDTVDPATGTVTTTLKCAPSDPCINYECKEGTKCVGVSPGDQAPQPVCQPYNPDADICDGFPCPDGYHCAVRRATCGGVSCHEEKVCLNVHDCEKCDITYQFCEIMGDCSTDNGGTGGTEKTYAKTDGGNGGNAGNKVCNYKGSCSDFKDRWGDR